MVILLSSLETRPRRSFFSRLATYYLILQRITESRFTRTDGMHGIWADKHIPLCIKILIQLLLACSSSTGCFRFTSQQSSYLFFSLAFFFREDPHMGPSYTVCISDLYGLIIIMDIRPLLHIWVHLYVPHNYQE